MHVIRIYVDTSVFGGVHDAEFSVASKRFFRAVRAGRYDVLLSRITLEELAEAPEKVRDVLKSLPESRVTEVPVTEETKKLAEAYRAAEAITKNSIGDSFHVATATISLADMILSWNFKHLVNFERTRKYNSVNLSLGYRPIEIHSPLEIAHDDEDEDI